MESGERLAPPSSASPSRRTAPSGPSSSTAPSSKSLAPDPPSLVTSCGHLFGTAREHPFNMSAISSAFPVVGHPAFGIYTTSSGRPEFGGLGTLGVTPALAAHPQLGAFPEWWRSPEAHGRGPAAFFPPLLGLPPFFGAPVQTLAPGTSDTRTPNRNGRSIPKGVNGVVNGTSPLVTPAGHVSGSTPPMLGVPEPARTSSSSGGSQELGKTSQMTKDEKQCKKVPETSSNSDSEAASTSDTSSEDVSSGDSEDLEEDDEDEDIQSIDSEDSDSVSESRARKEVKVLTQSSNQAKADGTRATDDKEPHDRNGTLVRGFSADTPCPGLLPARLPSQHPAPASSGQPLFQSPALEPLKPHRSVIQATGLAAGSEPLALLTQPSRETSPKARAPPSTPSPPTLSPSSVKSGSRSLCDEPLSQIHDFTLKAEHLKKLRTQQDLLKAHRKVGSPNRPPPHLSPELPGTHRLTLPTGGPHANLFLAETLLGRHRTNGVIHSTPQDAPLALVAKPRSQAEPPDKTPPAALLPVNLSTAGKSPPAAPLAPAGASPTPRLPVRPRQGNSRVPGGVSGLLQNHLAPSLVNLFRGVETDIHSSKDSDDSMGDEDEDEDDEEEDEDDEDEDSDGSLSESETNFGSDSDRDEGVGGTRTNGESEKILQKQTKSPAVSGTSDGDCSPLNLRVTRTPNAAISAPASSASSSSSSSHTVCRPPGSGKRERASDGWELRGPLDLGWPREAHIGNLNGRLQEDLMFYGPGGKKLRQYPDLVKGMQWTLLDERDVIPHILNVDGGSARQRPGDESRSRRKKGRAHGAIDGELPGAADAKLLRKLEAQEIARQAAQMKLMRKLEKQALAQAAKEARKQQAIMAAEEKRKQKEQIKILKQQEKIKRIQQIRMEKELRAQQILEAKRKKKEEAANAKILEAEKRTKEKEMRRQQAVLMKHQELERHRLDMERERRRQHMMLLKAVEARKKAEERERLKQEKRDEKRLNKERKLELRRLEMEMARELNKPNEDMCLADHKPLPELSRVAGLVLPGEPFSDCLMVLQFLRSFGKVLGLDVSEDVPTLGVLQEGLLNVGHGAGRVQDLLVRMLSAAVCDPGLPPGHRTKTALGEHLTSVGINRDNVSEILQMYMAAHCGQTELAHLAESLKTKAFQAHMPAQKASMLAFLVNELACSKSVVSEIDKNIDHMTNLRRDKCVIEGKLRKLRSIHAKKTGKRESTVGGEETQALGTPTAGRKRKRKGGDSDEDDDEEEDSDDQVEDDDDDDEDGKKGKKVEVCEEEDEGAQVASVEELEKQIDKLTKQQNQIRRKLFEASHLLRSMMFGQDRYLRRYWVLPQCGAVFVEGQGGKKGPEEHETESEWLDSAGTAQVKEEPQEEKPSEASQEVEDSTAPPTGIWEKDSHNLFLQNPSSFSKLGGLLETAKMSLDPDRQVQKVVTITVPTTTSLPAQVCVPSSPPPAAVAGAQPCPPGPAAASGLAPRLSEQLFRTLTEKSGCWFRLLPRTPCDDTSLTSGQQAVCSTSLPCPLDTSASAALQDHTSISTLVLPALQAKANFHLLGPLFGAWPSGILGPNLPLPSSSASTILGAGCPSLETSTSPLLPPSVTFSLAKSESPPPASEKTPSVPSPAVEVSKPQDFPTAQPIPEGMLRGWWKVDGVEELRALAEALHCRGVRERALQKQIQKHMEFIGQAFARNGDAVAIDVTELEENQVTDEMLESWCVEEQAMEVDIGVLQQVEELERKVTSASLQLKGWIHPEPQSEREDLVYREHKPLAGPSSAGNAAQENGEGGITRHPDNPLDIAVGRLAELEKNLERRYLKSPLSCTVQIRLDSVGTVTAPAASASADGDGEEEDIAPGLKVWRKAVSEARSAAQLSLCIQHLQKSIAWERSIMKVYCQMCRRGDNEDLLLLCDGCDKGWHTYCHRPKITTIPEGDWFCPTCISKASGQSPKNKKLPNRGNVSGGKKTPEVKRMKKASAGGEASEDGAASAGGTPKKALKDPKKKKGDETPPAGQAKPDSPTCTKMPKPSQENDRDLAFCRILLAELEDHHDAWPFLNPVNVKSVPGYRKVIKKPMDFSTIREKLCSCQYQNLEMFIIDVNLVFDNCEKFNEDNSEIGRAGHNMRKFFERRWTELLKTN